MGKTIEGIALVDTFGTIIQADLRQQINGILQDLYRDETHFNKFIGSVNNDPALAVDNKTRQFILIELYNRLKGNYLQLYTRADLTAPVRRNFRYPLANYLQPMLLEDPTVIAQLRPYPGARRGLERLQENSFSAVITSGCRPPAQKALIELLESYFSGCYVNLSLRQEGDNSSEEPKTRALEEYSPVLMCDDTGQLIEKALKNNPELQGYFIFVRWRKELFWRPRFTTTEAARFQIVPSIDWATTHFLLRRHLLGSALAVDSKPTGSYFLTAEGLVRLDRVVPSQRDSWFL